MHPTVQTRSILAAAVAHPGRRRWRASRECRPGVRPMSSPKENTPPAPRTTSTPHESSLALRSTTSCRPSIIGHVVAFSRSGRLSVTRMTPRSCSTSTPRSATRTIGEPQLVRDRVRSPRRQLAASCASPQQGEAPVLDELAGTRVHRRSLQNRGVTAELAAVPRPQPDWL